MFKNVSRIILKVRKSWILFFSISVQQIIQNKYYNTFITITSRKRVFVQSKKLIHLVNLFLFSVRKTGLSSMCWLSAIANARIRLDDVYVMFIWKNTRRILKTILINKFIDLLSFLFFLLNQEFEQLTFSIEFIFIPIHNKFV